MRMALGLAGLLVTLGVIVWVLDKAILPYNQAVFKEQKQATDQVQQIAGITDSGKPVEKTYTLFPDQRSDGKLQDFQVSHLDPDSPLATRFGLKENDVILAAIDAHGVRTDMNGADPESAKDAVRDAYTTNGHIIVQRGDQKLALPGNQPVNPDGSIAASPTPAHQPAQNSGNNSDANNPLKGLQHLPTIGLN